MLPSIKVIETLGGASGFSRKTQDDRILLSSESYASTVLSYQVAGGAPRQFFAVDVKATDENLSFRDPKQTSVSIKVSQNYDQNGSQTSSVLPDASGKQALHLQRVVKLDSRGCSAFSLQIGSSDNLAKGSLAVAAPTGQYLIDDSDYVFRASKDKTVEFVFYKKDVSSAADAKIVDYLLERLSRLRKSLKSLCSGHSPYGGVTQFIFTENIPYTALAGNPIYVDHAELAALLSRAKAEAASHDIHQDDTLCVLCHEMSHTFDFRGSTSQVAGYVFDREFFAILKEVYAFQDNGYTINKNFFGDVPPLSSGIYSYDGFLSSLLKKLYLQRTNNWDCIKEVLSSLRAGDQRLSDAEKFVLFIKTLSRKEGADISTQFTQTELKTLTTHFSD